MLSLLNEACKLTMLYILSDQLTTLTSLLPEDSGSLLTRQLGRRTSSSAVARLRWTVRHWFNALFVKSKLACWQCCTSTSIFCLVSYVHSRSLILQWQRCCYKDWYTFNGVFSGCAPARQQSYWWLCDVFIEIFLFTYVCPHHHGAPEDDVPIAAGIPRILNQLPP